MLAVIGFALFVVAGVLRLVGKHGNWVLDLIIIGGLFVAANCAWGWTAAPWHRK